MTAKFIAIFCTLVLLQAHLFSQQSSNIVLKRCPVKTINYQQGLLNNNSTNAVTDTKGFTWISTRTGLQRFNGYVLERINPVVGKKTIHIDYPVFFFKLKDGNFWISYNAGILKYDASSSTFTQIISLAQKKGFNFTVMPLKETPQGTWCLQANKGLVLCDDNFKIIKTYPGLEQSVKPDSILQTPDILPGNTVAANHDFIFLRNLDNQLIEINTHTGNYKLVTFNQQVLGFTCNDKFLYAVSATELIKFNIDENKIDQNILFKKLVNDNVTFSTIAFASNNQLLLSIGHYLFETDTSGISYKQLTTLNGDPVTNVGYIRNIYTDNFNRIWLLTNDDIKRVQDINVPFDHFIYAAEKNNFIRCLYYDENKHVLLAGSFGNGIQLYDTLGNALWQKPIVTQELKDINAIEKITDDDFLIQTMGKGWYRLHLVSRQITKLQLPPAVRNVLWEGEVNFCNNLQKIDDSAFLICTSQNVFRCVINHENIQSAKPLFNTTGNELNNINNLLYTKNKTLWAGTSTGKLYILVDDKKIITVNIPGNFQVRSFAEDSLHNMWVGTDRGLYVYSENGVFKKQFSTDNGLLNDCIYGLLPVNNKPAVFASTNLGLSYVDFNGEIKNFTKESGLQEDEFNTESATKTGNERFYFGGVNGITAFYASSLSHLHDTPVLNITKLIVNDSAYNIFSKAFKDSIFLNHTQNHIQLDFAALGLLNTDEYDYSYRLNGFEKNWQTTQQPQGIKYVLSPGTYDFEIRCSSVFSSNIISTKKVLIVISPPWWQTWWSMTFMIILLIAIIALIVHQYNRKKYLKQIRTMQLQQEVQHERERISRDLHDNLGAYAAAIASNVSSIQNTGDYADKNILSQLKINSQSIINQLNDTIWVLNKKEIPLTAISDHFKIFLQKIRPNYPGINVSVKEEIENDFILSSTNALHLFRVIQEAVNNALRHSNCSNVTIYFLSKSFWSVIIKDDGKGFSSFTDNSNKGNGLKNIQWRCEEAGWKVTWNNNSPGTGVVISGSANQDTAN